jgi:hypothetical protein
MDKMSDNRVTEDLMERLARVDNKLEKLIAIQAHEADSVLSEPLLAVGDKFADDLKGAPSGNDDNQESRIPPNPSKNPIQSRVAISAREMDSILQKVEKINHDAEILERVERLERQTRKTTILSSILMPLTLLMLGAFVFLLFQVNLSNPGGFFQAKEKVAAIMPSSGETTPAGDKIHPSDPVAKVDDLNAAKPVSKVNDAEVAKPALPEPDAKPAQVIAPVDLVGSITSNKYHYPGCKWAAQILPDKLIRFSSIAEARKRGYIPCPTCRPPTSE